MANGGTGKAVLREVAFYLKIAGTVALLLGWGMNDGFRELVGILFIVIAYLVQYVASTMGQKTGRPVAE